MKAPGGECALRQACRCRRTRVTAGVKANRQRAALARLEHVDGLTRAPEWNDGIRRRLRARLDD
jgi:hypothetical protein